MCKLDAAHKAFIAQHADENTHRLLLSASRFPDIDMEFVVRQLEGWRKAKEKFPSLCSIEDFIYPVKLSMEQCSSELTATYKAKLISGLSVVDLTGGLGIDAIFMSRESKEHCYVERNEELTQIAVHNFKATNAVIKAVCDDGLEFLRKSDRKFDCLYLDPARRDENKNKVVRLSACEPDVPANLKFWWQYADKILVKASPMLDISQAIKELGCVECVHVVAVRNECKELLFECCPNASAYTVISINLESGNETPFIFTPQEESDAVSDYASRLFTYLYEPNVAIMKAGAFRLTGQRFGLKKLHPDSHLYTSDILHLDFPGKRFQILSTGALNKQTVKSLLPGRKANIVVRNFPSKPEELKKKLGLIDGGDDYLFATTLHDGQKTGIFCRRI
ncbi:MAG: hypothetical protein H6Q17_2164 [Bacteroidetes bacterium]|nr:hypothetical protein [Bacteroidota bacterium]